MTDLERRRTNGWMDGEPDYTCRHGVNISVEGTCAECVRLRHRSYPQSVQSDYRRGYQAGYHAGIRRASSKVPSE